MWSGRAGRRWPSVRLLHSGEGLGALILQSGTTSKYNQLWSASVILLVIAVVICGVIGAIERVALARFGDIS